MITADVSIGRLKAMAGKCHAAMSHALHKLLAYIGVTTITTCEAWFCEGLGWTYKNGYSDKHDRKSQACKNRYSPHFSSFHRVMER